MKKLSALLVLASFACSTYAQNMSCASFLKAREKSDVVVPFRCLDEGVETPIEWGLDLQWLSEENIRRGVNFAGADLIDIIRTGYRATDNVEDGELSTDQINKIRTRANIIKKYARDGVGINIASDHGDGDETDSWYNEGSIGTAGRGKRWAQVIDLTIKKYKELGVTNIVSISPYNEPDYGWGQGYSSSTRKSDFLNTLKSLKEDYDGAYDNVMFCGGNTLNPDYAYDWWDYLKTYLDEGNTHQLAGSFDNYASFFERVRDYGHRGVADELHNTMEAMVGVEYGMQTGIWWGTCEYSRSQFMKATTQHDPGRRLAYAEHRKNWTAASLYRHTDGTMQAFGGTSERQGYETKYDFVSLDRPVWFNGERGREYVMTLPGGTGYQTGQSNAETVVDVQSGTDIMPHIDGTYKVMNANSGLLMGFSSNPSGWTSVTQKKNSNSLKCMQWMVKPMASTSGGDYTYYTFTLNTGNGMVLDILDWNMNAGADVGAYAGSIGTNEQWYLRYAGEGAFYIFSRFSAKCLEVVNGSSYPAANIQMAEFTGEKNQQWRFIPASVVPELVAPNPPTALTSTGQGSSVRLDWTASTSRDIASYTILRSDDGADFYTIASQVTGTSFIDNEAEDGVNYHYKAYAVDKCFNYSEFTETVTAASTAEKNCVTHLPMNATLNDTTENANHCALYGDASWKTGKVDGSALALNGTDNFIQLPYTVANHGAITIACWAYWQGGNSWQRLWDFGTGTSQYMFFSPKSDSGMRFAIKDGGDEQQIRISSNLSTNRWVHVVVTLGSDGARLYINGELQGQNAAVSIKPSDFSPVMNYIGRSQFNADPYFKGYIDDFRIYNYALSTEEVKELADYVDGIEHIETTSQEKGVHGSIYDLSGRVIPSLDSSSSSLYIKNGKKFGRITKKR